MTPSRHCIPIRPLNHRRRVLKNDLFERLAVAVPVDKQTAMSMSQGFYYKSAVKVTNREWENPPKMLIPQHGLNLVGTRFGRLKVMGLDVTKPVSKNSRAGWVCRCDCGRFTSRSTKAIRNQANNGDRCTECRHLQYLQRYTSIRRGSPSAIVGGARISAAS
jgi:hypothetical protein